MHLPGRVLAGLTDPTLASGLQAALAGTGLHVEWLAAGQAPSPTLQCGPLDCVVLDDSLPELDLLSWLAHLRTADPAVTVIVVCEATAATGRRIHLLDHGADDVQESPVDPNELAARVRAAARRQHGLRDAAAVLEHGPLRLQLDRRMASWAGRDVMLTSMEFWLLETLARRRDQVLTRALLEELLYGWNGDTSSNTVEVYVHHLRRKLHPRIVRTVRGLGYQLGRAEQLVAEPGADGSHPQRAGP